jgi:hypothetical protein
MHSAVLPIMLAAAGMGSGWEYFLRPAATPHHQLQFRCRNQRQVRKNARRAHANGVRNAFA